MSRGAQKRFHFHNFKMFLPNRASLQILYVNSYQVQIYFVTLNFIFTYFSLFAFISIYCILYHFVSFYLLSVLFNSIYSFYQFITVFLHLICILFHCNLIILKVIEKCPKFFYVYFASGIKSFKNDLTLIGTRRVFTVHDLQHSSDCS